MPVDLLPDFGQYAEQADFYLKRDIFKGTPLNGQMLSDAAQRSYLKTGVLVPVDLALAQAQFETKMGTLGRNPKVNPFNIGEYDKGTKIKFSNLQEGIDFYYNTMATRYLSNKDVPELLTNFVNLEGNRYASDKNYETKISNQIGFINKFILAMDKAVQGQKQFGIGALKH